MLIKSNESFLENENNTIYQSAKLLLNFMDCQMGVNIKIEKKTINQKYQKSSLLLMEKSSICEKILMLI